MTSPDPRDSERVPAGRLALWVVLVAVILLGIYLYFRHGRAITPLMGLER